MLVYGFTISSSLVTILHFLFAYRQIITWRTPAGLKALGIAPNSEKPFKVLALQQGVYNIFLALGLGISLLSSNSPISYWGAMFFLSCMTIAGIIGGLTAIRAILFAIPAGSACALILLFLKNQY